MYLCRTFLDKSEEDQVQVDTGYVSDKSSDDRLRFCTIPLVPAVLSHHCVPYIDSHQDSRLYVSKQWAHNFSIICF